MIPTYPPEFIDALVHKLATEFDPVADSIARQAVGLDEAPCGCLCSYWDGEQCWAELDGHHCGAIR